MLADIYAGMIKKMYPKIRDILLEKYQAMNIKTDAVDADPVSDLWKTIELNITDKAVTLKLERLHKAMSKWTSAEIAAATRKMKGLDNKEARSLMIEKAIADSDVLKMKDEFIANEKTLLEQTGKQFIEGMQDAAHNTFVNGGSMEDLADEMKGFADVSQSKAEFWGADQIGDAYAAYTEVMHRKGGFDNYEWRTMGDNHVRGNDPRDQTDHVQLNRMVFSWATGAANVPGAFSKPGARHPGQDYRCRCIALPSFKDVTSY